MSALYRRAIGMLAILSYIQVFLVLKLSHIKSGIEILKIDSIVYLLGWVGQA